jgi:hypothetical protein
VSFPIPSNTTCDIYRDTNAPPANPDVAGVSGSLVPMPRNLKSTVVYTHWIDVPLATDVRDADWLYVPDKNGTKFAVQWVERIRFGGGSDYKRAYLLRQAVNWPSQNL